MYSLQHQELHRLEHARRLQEAEQHRLARHLHHGPSLMSRLHLGLRQRLNALNNGQHALKLPQPE